MALATKAVEIGHPHLHLCVKIYIHLYMAEYIRHC